MIGTKFYKPLETEEQMNEYSTAADWCNETQKGMIVDQGEYYEVVEIPGPTLEEAKASKINELKSIRDNKEVEPIQIDKGLFDYDDKSRDRLAIARQALTDADNAGTITWTTADNQRVPLGIVDFANINAAAAVRSNQLHITYNELKEQVNSATTIEDVEAIVWP